MRKNKITIIGRGDFGNMYRGPRGRAAIDFILSKKEGEVISAFSKQELGDIDLVYGRIGENGYGIAHIVEKHPELLRCLTEVINNGRVFEQGKDRVLIIEELPEGKRIAAVRLDWNGRNKKWIVSAFEKL